LLFSKGAEVRPRDFPEPLRKAGPRRSSPKAAPTPAGRVVDMDELERLLRAADSVPVPGGRTWEVPWHVDHARRAYLEVLIRHCRGNIRKMAAYWDRSSPFTLRALLKRFGLWDAVLRARNSEK